MIQEVNLSKNDVNISVDTIYHDDKHRQIVIDTQTLIQEDSKHTCCDSICIWWFQHSSFGLETYDTNQDDKQYRCICCNCCTWCCEFKSNYKYGIKEIGCCCISILFK